MNQPNVWILDIESSPLITYSWGIRDQYLDLANIKEDWKIIAFAAKRLGDSPSKVVYADLRKMSERELLKKVWKILDEADILITQNGKNFDSPKLNARFIIHGIKPPRPYKHLDTYQIIRSVAKGTSNKLEYWTAKLNKKYKKLKHTKFPGLALWKECMAGNIDAWNEMQKYNIHDVLSTEEFYMNIRAWTPDSMPNVYNTSLERCGVCHSKDIRPEGHDYTRISRFKQIACNACGKWTRGKREAL